MNLNHGDKPYVPYVGEHLYLQPGGRSCGFSADIKNPYTVVSVSNGEVVVQEACCVFAPDDNHYNSFPTEIRENGNGRLLTLHWSDKIGGGSWWNYKGIGGRDYPEIAHFGAWEYYPYLD